MCFLSRLYLEAQVTYSPDSFQSSFTPRGTKLSVSLCTPCNLTKEHFPFLSVSRLARCPQQLDLRINNKQPSHPMPFPPHPLFLFVLRLLKFFISFCMFLSSSVLCIFYALLYFGFALILFSYSFAFSKPKLNSAQW